MKLFIDSQCIASQQEKQEIVGNFVSQNAHGMRETFCEKICPLHGNCLIYNSIR
jgi:hypothetical protein